jgi:dolichol-phosphate mannosyltransferase
MPLTPRQQISIVVPAYNEEGNVEALYSRVSNSMASLEEGWELIFAVDPCTDGTERIILDLIKRDPRVKMLRFSRRFGQPMATLAGLEAATGDATVVIDCDLQDPPELIPMLISKWHEGYDVVYAQRRHREGETVVKRMVAAVGYRVINRIAEVQIPPNTGDFRLMSRRVVQNIVSLSESHGFLRGLVALVGFPQTAVQYDREARAAGSGKYNRFTGSVRIGFNGIVGFSRYPLQVISIVGLFLAVAAISLGFAYLGAKLAGAGFPIGNPTIVILVCLLGGIQLLSLGVMGEYVGRIYDEVRRRPKYVVQERHGFDSCPTLPQSANDALG